MYKLVLAMLLVAALPVAAQQGRGTILGTVTDSSGAAVPGATVAITNTGTNIALRTTTNGEGYYTMPGVAVGEYAVSAECTGFKKSVRTGITLQVDQKAQVDLVLQVGATSDSIEVTAEVPPVDASSATVGKVVEQRRVSDLPVNGRSAFALML
ncbi:MAG TPA: carboxypeptidase-like regulatory domain-containing protein, partial [Bryobacteraceae bacterium]|nr:carboxypeptidase-like regulatory domain-containing protein [Bryobacteraceae bacterium]